jgi:shikimate dehydrogenase
MKRFALLGTSLGHSFSKVFFEKYFTENQLNAEYDNVELESINLLRPILQERKYDGFNVTIPFKESIIPLLDGLDETAVKIGAVNVVALQNEKWIGYNTDAFGFQQSIKPFLMNVHERALVLGTGGASKAVSHVFQEIGIDVITISRTPKGTNQFSYGDINQFMVRACKVVVNCTPVGMYPNVNQCVTFPFNCLSPDHLVVDLIYNPEKTLFLQNATQNGAMTLNGASMLMEQALRALQIWNN